MTFAIRLLIVSILGIGWSSAALAQSQTLVGTWSWQMSDPSGPIYNTLLINGNGTYVDASRNSRGQMLRYDGIFRVLQVGPNQLQLQLHTQRWYPASVCSQIASMGINNCVPMPQPADINFGIALLSPGAIQVDGATAYRDPNPVLLSAQIPVTLVNNLAAPAQIVAPTLQPYDQSGVHKGVNDFIYGRLRGCSYKTTDPTGTYYSGCDR